ncbi:MAG: aspartate/glutamate racemase family protein [Gammaproteobacteria bacterium]|nr:aspartate/glutamate racemase family protein [Gammaproteobacteria bacterium]
MNDTHIALGGKTIAGASLGILVLQSQFPRVLGDGGNARTWPFPMLYKVVSGATPDRVVRRHADGWVNVFMQGAKELVAAGADGITTNCGFLVLHQKALSEACGVPVGASSLLQVPWVQTLLPPGQRVGVITIAKHSLTPEHLRQAGAPLDTPVEGTDSGQEFTRVLLDDQLELNTAAARQDIIDAGQRLITQNPDVGAVVLECTNMPPYAASLAQAIRRPVYDFYSFVTWFHAGLVPRQF